MSPFEHSARLAKVAKLVAALDVSLTGLGIHPFSVEAARAVVDLDEAGWLAAARAAQVNAPSAQTRALVVELYEARPDHVDRAAKAAGVAQVKVECPRCSGSGGWCAACGHAVCARSSAESHPEAFSWSVCPTCDGAGEVSATVAQVYARRRAMTAAPAAVGA